MRYYDARVIKRKMKLRYSIEELVSDERFKLGICTFKWNNEFHLYLSFVRDQIETDYNENSGLLFKC